MKSHHETIICPECKAIELAEVKHKIFGKEIIDRWYEHQCTKCGQYITKEHWNTTGWLYNGDMMDFLYNMKSSIPGLVIITDPPYGVRKDEKWDDALYFQQNIRGWLSECLRVTESTVVWFCANRMFPYIFKSIQPEQFLREHHWNKQPGNQFAGASNNKIWYSSEPILVFTKNKELTTKNFDEDADYNYDDLKYDSVAKKIWNHPTVKPVGLIAQLVLHYSKSTDTILDPFAGSGTTAEICIKTGRKYICIEQDPQHYQTILDRINNINSQLGLF